MRGAPAGSADTAILCDRANTWRFLVANGYQLAEVERVIVGERTGDEVYDETLSSGEDTDPESDDTGEDRPRRDTEPDTGDDTDSDQQ